ncbi:MAG: hypothetical protein K2H55_07580 [Helicobacter sp.]|nr:hypothetical protein [Helicobacter sp.]
MQNDTIQQLEAEMLAHIGACCLEICTTAWVDYANPLLPREIAKHGARVALAGEGDAALPISELVIAASVPSANLRHGCVLLTPIPNLVHDFHSAKAALQSLGERFGILMPFALWNLSPNPSSWFAFASDSTHPLASLSLQRAELLDGCDWYSAAMHQAAFVLPPHLARALRGIVRN